MNDEWDDRPQYHIEPPRQQPIFDLGPLMNADAEQVRLAREAVALERERLSIQVSRTAADRKRALVAATVFPSIHVLIFVCIIGVVIACTGIMLLSFLPQGVGWALIFFGALVDILAFVGFGLGDAQKQRVKKNLE